MTDEQRHNVCHHRNRRRGGTVYVEMVHSGMLLPLAVDTSVTICLRLRVVRALSPAGPSPGSGGPLLKTRGQPQRH
jgi:hypothetical protein